MAIGDYLSGAAQTGSAMDPMCGGFELTKKQRFYGFGICFVLGFVISLLSTLLLTVGSIAGFAVFYTCGNIISLLSTGFLIGFKSQFKKMLDASRLTASIVFLVSMVATLVVAFTRGPQCGPQCYTGTDIGNWQLKSVLLTLICCFIQFLALFWYSLSYIPFARDLFKNMCGGFFK
ncbi:Got1/Sft2-like family-domain-containing protein [Powellomyces hirtus]|nr:Got1/Sft2-like family-domain-containing protein [Powellomyces hirtus]